MSPGVEGVAVAGQWLGGGSRVHVASVWPSGRGRFGGVMLLHRRHGGPWAGALGPSCSPFLLIGTGETHMMDTSMRTSIKAHVTAEALRGGDAGTSICFQVDTTNRASGEGWVVNSMWSALQPS